MHSNRVYLSLLRSAVNGTSGAAGTWMRRDDAADGEARGTSGRMGQGDSAGGFAVVEVESDRSWGGFIVNLKGRFEIGG